MLYSFIKMMRTVLFKKNKSDPETKKTHQMLIWGCNDFSKCLLKLLSGSCVNIVGFVDTVTDEYFCGLKVYHPSKIQSISELQVLPIIIAVPHVFLRGLPKITFESMRLFKLALSSVLEEYKLKNELLHPAALSDFLYLDVTDKIITFGTQGSGNVIYNNLLQKIVEHYYPIRRQNERALFFSRMCEEYTAITRQTWQDILHIHGARDMAVMPWKIGTTCFTATLNDARLTIYAFATKEHLSHFLYAYHNLISETYLSKLTEMNFKLFLIVRNPLDIILSSLKKRSLLRADPKEVWSEFCLISAIILAHLRKWYESKSFMHLLRYEDLINYPEQQIIELMRHLGVHPSRRLAKKLWSNMGFKQLPTAPKNHFWSGGTGKWESYFSRDHLLFLKKCGIEEILRKFEYGDILEKFNDLLKFSDQDEMTIQEMPLPEVVLCDDEHKDTLTYLQNNMAFKESCVQVGNFIIQGEKLNLSESLLNSLISPYISMLGTCGVYHEFRFN